LLKHVVLGSRKMYCVNTSVNCYGDSDAINAGCNTLCASNGCCYKRGLQEYSRIKTPLREQISEELSGSKAFDIEDLKEVLEGRGICPFFAASEYLARDADVVFCPYVYLINPGVRASMKVDLDGSIIILDGDRYLERDCLSAADFTLNESDLQSAIDDVDGRKADLEKYQLKGNDELNSSETRVPVGDSAGRNRHLAITAHASLELFDQLLSSLYSLLMDLGGLPGSKVQSQELMQILSRHGLRLEEDKREVLKEAKRTFYSSVDPNGPMAEVAPIAKLAKTTLKFFDRILIFIEFYKSEQGPSFYTCDVEDDGDDYRAVFKCLSLNLAYHSTFSQSRTVVIAKSP